MAKLLLYSDEYTSVVSGIAAIWKIGTKEQINVKTWAKLAQEIWQSFTSPLTFLNLTGQHGDREPC